MPDLLTAREMTLLALFSAAKPFVIPAYQREYSWTDAETGRLLDDLWAWAFEDQGGRRRKADRPLPYFLGSILTCDGEGVLGDGVLGDGALGGPSGPRSGGLGGGDGARVVDGHQRLITLTILFAVLRDLEDHRERKRSLDDLVRRRGRTLWGQSSGWRVEPMARDAAGFERLVQTDGATKRLGEHRDRHDLPDAQKRMVANGLLLRERLMGESGKARRAFATRLVTQAYVATITVADEDAAFAMFEVINQRGQPLGAKHVIKSRLMEAFERDSDTERAANAVWSGLEAQFPIVQREGQEPIDTFERLLDAFAKLHDMAGRLKHGRSLIGRVTAALNKVGPVEALESALPKVAEAYAHVAVRPVRVSTGLAEFDRVCEYLSWWEDEEWTAAAMKILSANAGQEITLKALRQLERFTAVMGLASEKKDRRLQAYRKIMAGCEDLYVLTREGGPLTPRRELLHSARDKVCDVLPPDKLKRRAILARVSALLDPGRLPPTPSRAGTIEHILPRAAISKAEVLALYPGWSRTQAKASMETLGNLALADETVNAQGGAAGFGDKLAAYFPRADQLNPYSLLEDLRLHGVSAWTPDAWDARQTRLTSLLVEAWGL